VTVILRSGPGDVRHELLRTSIGGEDADPETGMTAEERQRMLAAGSSTLVSTAGTLDRIEAVTRESEATGVNTLVNLRRQRETIHTATDAARETQEAAGLAGQQIGLMQKALTYNLCTQLCLILAMITMIVMIVYLKWIR